MEPLDSIRGTSAIQANSLQLGQLRVAPGARHLVEGLHSNEVLAAPSKWAVVGEQRSDGFGNVYYRLSTEDDRIHRLTASGVDEVVPLSSGGQDVAVSDAGSLFQLGNNSRREAWVAEFDPSGARVSTTILRPAADDTWIVGLRLARFSSGHFLVMGYQFAKDSGKATPLIAIFDEDGFQVSDVRLSAGGQRLGVGKMGFFDAASLGAAALDSQGDRVYLALPGIDKPLLTVEPSGEISNVLPVTASHEGMQLTNFRVKGDKAVLTLRGDTSLPDGRRSVGVVYKIFDLKTRKLISSFHEENFIGDVVSFNGEEEFTNFVSLSDRRYLMHISGGQRR